MEAKSGMVVYAVHVYMDYEYNDVISIHLTAEGAEAKRAKVQKDEPWHHGVYVRERKVEL